MNKFIVLYLFAVISCNAQVKISYVNDYASILSMEERDELSRLYSSHEKKTTNQIILVITNDIEGEASIRDFAIKFGNKYGIGHKGEDNGIVIALDMANRDIFIATGYGIEIVLEDHELKEIIDNSFIPHFKEGEFYIGLLKGSESIIDHLELPENMVF